MAPDAGAVRYTFSYDERLHRDRDFQHVFKKGRKLVHPALFIYVYRRPEGGEARRLGLVTSRKVGSAVKRNRLKRRLREIFRLNKHNLAPGIDIIFVLRSAAVSLDYRQLSEIVMGLFAKAGAVL
ncbi:MAG: ribonuclease P protein component [Elusimicrobia bacterium RIFOXYB2_FULL_50_12]|nr:MAG: ribonuclease P protein component [Elusimicrobia bacterium RIFOXYB2_FULL_50_12]